jgi:rRNA small subunit pseudouridine methyltransferase Nep1
MLNVILLDCALELVPSQISGSKEIQKHASKRKKKPTELLLDQSVHGRSMTKLPDSQRRGRPDIAYLSLLTLLETPLCKDGQLNVFLHLQDGRIVLVSSDVRLPRSYDRFVGLIEQLLQHGRVPTQGSPLLEISKENLPGLISRLAPAEQTFLAIEEGERTPLSTLEQIFTASPDATVGIGAFPHGDFSEEVKSLFNRHMELDRDVMMAWHTCAAVVWIYSKSHRVVSQRYASLEQPEQ